MSALLLALSIAPPTAGLQSDAPGGPASAAAAGPAPIPAARAATNLVVITIYGEITGVTASSIERRIAQAVAAKADGIVFEINSPGGEVGAVLDICRQIKQCPISNTIAWINPTAYSGGAIIALACREIVLTSAATMGDAAPVAGDPINFAQGLQATERQKILAPLLAEVVDSARLRGYDEFLVQGFLTLGVELWLIRDKATGEEYFVDENEYRAVFGEKPPRGRPHVPSGSISDAQGQGLDEAEADHTASSPESSGSVDGFKPASPTITPETVSDVELELETASQRPTFTAADRGRFELIEYATDGNTLLTLKEGDLRRYGFADPNVTIKTDEDLKQFVGAQHLRRLDQNWSESLVAFMTQGMTGLIVRGVLIIIFIMALFIEMSMPGVGLPGVIALVALGGLIVPPMLIGASTWWALALILGGILLVLLEVFVLPGFGLPGILGLVMLFGGLVGTFANVGELFPGSGSGNTSEATWAASIVLLSMFIAGVGIYFFTRYTDKFPIAGKLVLADRAVMRDDEDGQSMLAAMSPTPSAAKGLVDLGAVGLTATPLRPSGSAVFNDRFVDVVSELGFVDMGRPVRVVSVSEYRVGVEPVRDGPADQAGAGGGGTSSTENRA